MNYKSTYNMPDKTILWIIAAVAVAVVAIIGILWSNRMEAKDRKRREDEDKKTKERFTAEKIVTTPEVQEFRRKKYTLYLEELVDHIFKTTTDVPAPSSLQPRCVYLAPNAVTSRGDFGVVFGKQALSLRSDITGYDYDVTKKYLVIICWDYIFTFKVSEFQEDYADFIHDEVEAIIAIDFSPANVTAA